MTGGRGGTGNGSPGGGLTPDGGGGGRGSGAAVEVAFELPTDSEAGSAVADTAVGRRIWSADGKPAGRVKGGTPADDDDVVDGGRDLPVEGAGPRGRGIEITSAKVRWTFFFGEAMAGGIGTRNNGSAGLPEEDGRFRECSCGGRLLDEPAAEATETAGFGTTSVAFEVEVPGVADDFWSAELDGFGSRSCRSGFLPRSVDREASVTSLAGADWLTFFSATVVEDGAGIAILDFPFPLPLPL